MAREPKADPSPPGKFGYDLDDVQGLTLIEPTEDDIKAAQESWAATMKAAKKEQKDE